jgi:hypothetical protein
MEHHRTPFDQYIDSMRRNTPVARDSETDTRLELIRHLAEQVAAAPAHSRQHRTLSAEIRVEAAAYRKSLDTEQAAATHDADPRPAVERGSLNTRRTVGPDG